MVGGTKQMLKSTLFCFGVVGALNGTAIDTNDTTCIQLVKPEYVTPHSSDNTKNLKKIQKTFFKATPVQKIATDLDDIPTKPILIIKAIHTKK